MTYKDKCYCTASNFKFCEQNGLKYCDNKDCWRHCSEIPKDLPEWELIAYADFSDRCKERKLK